MNQNIIPFKDKFGREIKVGDFIAYATRGSCRPSLKTAYVLAVIPYESYDWVKPETGPFQKVPAIKHKLKVRTTRIRSSVYIAYIWKNDRTLLLPDGTFPADVEEILING